MPVKKSTTQSSDPDKKPKRKPKKTGAKKRAASSAKTSAPKKKVTAATRTPEVEQEIAHAVARIPQLLRDEARMERREAVRMPTPVEREPMPKPTRIGTNPPSRQKYRLLWLGVALVSLAVFGMWIWSAMSLIYDVQNSREQDPAPWNEAGDELRDILDSFNAEKPEQKTTTSTAPQTIDLNDKEAVENALRALLQKQKATTSSDSNTPAAMPTATTSTASSTTQTEI